jgi:pSer/pThr/pTyr-binding forkhead associated (FHA) protein
VVLDYPMVSAHHARITLAGGQARIEDLGSTNGTALGRPERKITEAPLPADGVVFFGSLRVPAPRLLGGGLGLGEKPCTVVAFRGRSVVFGRDPGCDQVLNYPMVSARHSRLWRAGAGLWLEDLHSSNGTFLNGRRIRQAVSVKPGDVIGLGSYTFKLTDAGHLEQRDYRGNVTLEARGATVEIPGRRVIEQVSLTIFPEPGRPARGGRGLRPEPAARGLDLPERPLRRRRLHRRQHGPPRPPAWATTWTRRATA